MIQVPKCISSTLLRRQHALVQQRTGNGDAMVTVRVPLLGVKSIAKRFNDCAPSFRITNKCNNRTISTLCNTGTCNSSRNRTELLSVQVVPTRFLYQYNISNKQTKLTLTNFALYDGGNQYKYRYYSSTTRLLQTSSQSHSSSSAAPLHYEWIHSKNTTTVDNNNISTSTNKPTIIVFIHGLLGNVKNIKTMATKICTIKQCSGIMIDLPGHGRTYETKDNKTLLDIVEQTDTTTEQEVSLNTTTTTILDQTVLLVQQTITIALSDYNKSSSQNTNNTDNIILIGHSLGGRIVLHYTYKNLIPQPDHVWLLDTVPGKVDESVYTVLQSAQTIQDYFNTTNTTTTNKDDTIPTTKNNLVSIFQNPPYNLNLLTSQWLATSYNTTSKSFNFNLLIANKYVTHGIHQQNIIQCIQDILLRSNTTTTKDNTVLTYKKPCIHLIIGKKNNAWNDPIIQQSITTLKETVAAAVAAANDNDNNDNKSQQLTFHELPNAGHWVHVDDLPGLLDAIDSI